MHERSPCAFETCVLCQFLANLDFNKVCTQKPFVRSTSVHQEAERSTIMVVCQLHVHAQRRYKRLNHKIGFPSGVPLCTCTMLHHLFVCYRSESELPLERMKQSCTRIERRGHTFGIQLEQRIFEVGHIYRPVRQRRPLCRTVNISKCFLRESLYIG